MSAGLTRIVSEGSPLGHTECVGDISELEGLLVAGLDHFSAHLTAGRARHLGERRYALTTRRDGHVDTRVHLAVAGDSDVRLAAAVRGGHPRTEAEVVVSGRVEAVEDTAAGLTGAGHVLAAVRGRYGDGLRPVAHHLTAEHVGVQSDVGVGGGDGGEGDDGERQSEQHNEGEGTHGGK